MRTKVSVSLPILMLILFFHMQNSWAQGWRYRIIDSNFAGVHCSIALDLDGYPNICYTFSKYRGLWYAYEDISGWHTEPVDDVGVGKTSLVMDQSGNPHVAYYDDRWGICDLRYAIKVGTAWTIEVVDSYGVAGKHASIAIDSKGFPHIAHIHYYDGRNYLKYVWKDEAGWHGKTLWGSNSTWYHPSNCAIALDALDRPFITFFESKNLYLGWYDGSSWIKSLLRNDVDTGTGTSIAIDKRTGKICIAFNHEKNEDLVYGENDGSGWSWITLDSYGNVGDSPSVVLDYWGYPHIAYYDQQNRDVKYAHQDQNGWHVETVANYGYVGQWVDIALNVVGEPHICYFDDSNDDLMYAYPSSYGPQSFSLIAPENGSWAVGDPFFLWYPSSYRGTRLANYELWVDGLAVVTDITPTRPFVSPELSLTDGWHTWKVKAVETTGNEIWSNET